MLCDEFLKEMNIDGVPILEKAMACQALKEVVEVNRQYDRFRGDTETYFPKTVLEDKYLIRLLDITGYWGNDLMDIIILYLSDNNIDSPLVEGYNSIFAFLDKRRDESQDCNVSESSIFRR